MLVRDVRSGVYTLLRVPMVCPLHVVDRTTGETLLDSQVEQTHVHSLDRLVKDFPMRIDATTCDRAGSNLRCEEGLYSQRRLDRLRFNLPCAIHCCSVAQGRSYAPVGKDISGAIAMALAMKPGGAVGAFRAAVQQVLEDRVRFHDIQPPPPGAACSLHREAVLKIAFSSAAPTAHEQNRMELLRLCLNGDWRLDAVDVCWPGLPPDKAAWATVVAVTLVPEAIALFPRNRWLQSAQSIMHVMLLANVHNILTHCVPVWLSLLKGSEVKAAVGSTPCGWDLSDDDDEGGSRPRRDCEEVAVAWGSNCASSPAGTGRRVQLESVEPTAARVHIEICGEFAEGQATCYCTDAACASAASVVNREGGQHSLGNA